MGILDNAAKTAGQVRDTAHTALGGKNASGLKQKIVTAQGTEKVEAKAPSGYIVTGGGWYCEALGDEDCVRGSYPSSEGTGWTVEMGFADRGGTDDPSYTVYAVCVADDN